VGLVLVSFVIYHKLRHPKTVPILVRKFARQFHQNAVSTVQSTPAIGGGKTRVSGRRTLQERRSASKFEIPLQQGFENLLPNATKPGEAEPLSC
jgi:hypothetical protein